MESINQIQEEVHRAKHFGVHIGSKLTFNIYAKEIVKKANSTHTFLARNIAQCSRKVKQSVQRSEQLWNIHRQCGTCALSTNTNKIEGINIGVLTILVATLFSPAVCLN